jgi:DivIVA domain-containing protein
MGQFLIVLALALVLGAVVFGVTVLIVGGDQGLEPVEPDGRAVPLPTVRPLTESDLVEVRFDVAFRGYRMAQVDQALRRSAYDLGYKEELIGVLEAEVEALREGRQEEADKLREARLAAARVAGPGSGGPAGPGETAEAGTDLDALDATDLDGDTDLEDGADADGPEGPRIRDGQGQRAGVAIDLGIVSDTAAEPAK